MLKPDEHEILKLLSSFGALRRNQIVEYFRPRMHGNISRMLNALCTKHCICHHPKQDTFSLICDKDWKNESIVRAFDIFLQMRGKRTEVYRAEEPAQLHFFRHGAEYEIVDVRPGKERQILYRLRDRRLQYIFIVRTPDQIPCLQSEDAFVFCTVSEGTVEFYHLEKGGELT